MNKTPRRLPALTAAVEALTTLVDEFQAEHFPDTSVIPTEFREEYFTLRALMWDAIDALAEVKR